MTVYHHLRAYDERTEEHSAKWLIPEALMEQIKSDIMTPADDDPDAIYAYDITAEQALQVAGLIGIHIDTKGVCFTIEGCSEP